VGSAARRAVLSQDLKRRDTSGITWQQTRQKQSQSFRPINPSPQTIRSIIAALRTRLKTRDAQITELKAQLRERDHIIATLRGELARTPPANEQQE